MIKQAIAAAALGSLLALGSVPAMAAQHGGAGWSHHEGAHSKMMKQLDLTADQQAKVKAIFKDNFAQTKEQRADVRTKRKAFMDMKPTDSGYQAAADALAQAEGQAATTRVEGMAKVRSQVWALLTPAQQAKWTTLHQERQKKWEEHAQKKAAKHAEKSADPATN